MYSLSARTVRITFSQKRKKVTIGDDHRNDRVNSCIHEYLYKRCTFVFSYEIVVAMS